MGYFVYLSHRSVVSELLEPTLRETEEHPLVINTGEFLGLPSQGENKPELHRNQRDSLLMARDGVEKATATDGCYTGPGCVSCRTQCRMSVLA